ncbi:hypothetical protein ACE1SV_62670 [Streptomyces sennicomposti]
MWSRSVRGKTLARPEESVARIRWGSGGKHRKPIRGGLIVAMLRHYESGAAESEPLLHDHAMVSIRARRLGMQLAHRGVDVACRPQNDRTRGTRHGGVLAGCGGGGVAVRRYALGLMPRVRLNAALKANASE